MDNVVVIHVLHFHAILVDGRTRHLIFGGVDGYIEVIALIVEKNHCIAFQHFGERQNLRFLLGYLILHVLVVALLELHQFAILVAKPKKMFGMFLDEIAVGASDI